jgi:hypothetical protein
LRATTADGRHDALPEPHSVKNDRSFIRIAAILPVLSAVIACVMRVIGAGGGPSEAPPGRIEGLATVMRPRIDSVPYGKVTLSPLGIETKTDSLGHFAFDSVPAGRYRLELSAFLYKPSGIDVEVAPAQTTKVHIVLELDEGAYQHYRFNAGRPQSRSDSTPAPPPR